VLVVLQAVVSAEQKQMLELRVVLVAANAAGYAGKPDSSCVIKKLEN
jgi:hypothetical protein